MGTKSGGESCNYFSKANTCPNDDNFRKFDDLSLFRRRIVRLYEFHKKYL